MDRGHHRTLVFLVIGSIAVIGCILGYMWVMRIRKEPEPFQGNVDSILNLLTGGPTGGSEETAMGVDYSFDDANNVATSKQAIPSRMCAIFYTNNVDLCNDNINNWYTRPMNELRQYRDTLSAMSSRTAAQDKQLDAANRAIADREGGQLPKGTCKVEFPGWIEPTVTANGEPFPYKNKATFDNINRLYPDDWAFCYKESDSVENAVAQSKTFADEYVVKSFDTAGDYFQDGKVYSKIAFTTMHLADNLPSGAVARAPRATEINSFVCSTQPPPLPNIPPTVLVFELTNDMLRSMYIASYNKATFAFEQVNDSDIIFQGLFETRTSGRSLYLVPKLLTGSIFQLSFDVCGRLSGNSASSKEFSLSLMRDLGVQPRLLYTAPSKESPTFGTLEELKSRVAEMDAQIGKVNQDIAAMIASIPSTPKYVKGHIRYTYALMMNNQPSMANASALDIIFNGTDATTQQPNAVLQSRQVLTSSPSERTSDTSRTKYGYIIEGYINIGALPSNRYYFKINSDEGGDFTIDDRVVATHYNYHLMDDRGVKLDFRLERNKFYKFRARFAQWTGASGIALQWKTGNTTTYSDIPGDVFYYDENDNKRYEAMLRQKEIASASANRVIIQQAIDSIENRRNQFMQIAFQNIGNRRMTQWKDYVSVDGKLYVDIGTLDGTLGRRDEQALGQIILQEQSTSITGGVKEFPSPVTEFNGNIQYSISFWIYVGQTFPNWTNIFYHGVNDSWTQFKEGDRTPGIWLYPNGTRIHFRQRSSVWGNDGCDTYDGLPMNRWVHFTAVVNGSSETIFDQPAQSIQLYLDGQKLQPKAGTTNFKQLAQGNVWHWGQQIGKKARVGYNPNVATGKGVFVQKVYWYNRILGADEVLDIYNNSGVLRNRRAECRDVETPVTDAYGWKTNTLAKMNVQCEKDEVLSKLSLVGVNGDNAKYDYRCCRIGSDDPIKVTSTTGNTLSANYNEGSVGTLSQLNLDCQSKALQKLSYTANVDRDYAYYDYTCGEHGSSVNLNVKCTPKSTPWVVNDGTMKPLTTLQVKCEDYENISQMQVKQDPVNNQIRYDYSCCEVGGL